MNAWMFSDDWNVTGTSPYQRDNPFYYGNILMTGNGYLGFRGTAPDWGADEYSACVVSDTYDNADGIWKELCTVPNGLYAAVSASGKPVTQLQADSTIVQHGLNFRYGLTYGAFQSELGEHAAITLSWERFASYDDLHIVMQKLRITAESHCPILLRSGIDGNIWSLNGRHIIWNEAIETVDHILIARAETLEKQLPVVIASTVIGMERFSPEHRSSAEHADNRFLKACEISLEPHTPVEVATIMAIYTGNDCHDPESMALQSIRSAAEQGYAECYSRHRKIWDTIWEDVDIGIEADDPSSGLIRYSTYHNIIATPAHTDHLPIGARGLSCQGYQGAAFWDQEIYNLPMYIYTRPDIARSILTYRYNTLDGARKKAADLGYMGAFYPWVSGDTGEELCPSYFFIDVLSGRKIRNHFNDWQIHISPDIAYAVWWYYAATGDWGFMTGMGAEMIFDIAHFLYSRIHYNTARDRYEILRVLGPDEYHENADNNLFTNVQARFTLEKAVLLHRKLQQEDTHGVASLLAKLGITDEEVGIWQAMADKLYISQPDSTTLLLEQFDGYFDLEDITPEEAAARLINTEEYWGWPNGVAFETQVIKQADVIQLFVLHDYPVAVIEANYDYYNPRTQHRSSLSKGTYAMIAARLGRTEEALEKMMQSLLVDLGNTHPPTSGGTFIGGIHTAACGLAWQIVLFGFLGMSRLSALVSFNPKLPTQWKKVRTRVVLSNHPVEIEVTAEHFTVRSAGQKSSDCTPFPPLEISCCGSTKSIAPGKIVTWELSSR